MMLSNDHNNNNNKKQKNRKYLEKSQPQKARPKEEDSRKLPAVTCPAGNEERKLYTHEVLSVDGYERIGALVDHGGGVAHVDGGAPCLPVVVVLAVLPQTPSGGVCCCQRHLFRSTAPTVVLQ